MFTGPHLSGRLSEGRHQSVIDVENALKKEGIPYLLVDEVEKPAQEQRNRCGLLALTC